MPKLQTLPEFWQYYQVDQTTSLDHHHTGSVYEAIDAEDRTWAVKISEVHPNFDNGLFLERYMIAQTLEHDNLLEYKEAYRYEGDLMTNVAVMPLIPLGSLDQHIVLTVADKALIVEQIIDGLYYLHQHGVTWQNLSAKHILLDQYLGNYVPKFINYGNKMTIPLAFFADYEYLAPEQLEGKEEIDSKTDIWALGVLLYQVWTGRLPFGEKSASFPNAKIKQRILQDWTPGLLYQLPEPYQQIVKKCLQRDPNERWDDCGQIIEVIKDWYAQGNTLVEHSSKEENTEKKRKIVRKPNKPIVWWQVVLGLLAAAALGWWVNNL